VLTSQCPRRRETPSDSIGPVRPQACANSSADRPHLTPHRSAPPGSGAEAWRARPPCSESRRASWSTG